MVKKTVTDPQCPAETLNIEQYMDLNSFVRILETS